MKKLVVGLGAVAGGYLALLVIAGWLLPGCVEQRIERRLAASLDAEVSVGAVDLALFAGHVTVSDLRIVRDGGAVDIRVQRTRAEIASWGRVIYDRDLTDVTVAGVDVTLTGAGAAGLRGERRAEPVRMDSLRLEDVDLTLMPSALLPRLGRVEIHLDRAVTGPLVLRNAMSWLYALDEIHAVVDVGGASAAIDYAGGELAVGAGLLGSRPITVPFQLPTPDPDALELEQLEVLALALARTLAPEAAKRWLGRQVLDRLFE